MKRIILAALAATLMLPSILQAQTPGPVTPGEAGTIIGSGLGKMSAGEVGSGLLRWLGDIMGMEIGTIMIDNVNYSKLTLTPEIRIGRLKLGLYLPVIYTSNIFDPTDWYHPEGNDEWSFGSGYWQTDPYTAALDALSDTALKIKYLEYGEQLVDPFFVKVGNLDSLTIGHGLLMRNYRNNTEFPAVRKVGFNLGIDAKSVGFEALVNDLAHPRLYGARLYARPFRNSKLAFGISGVLDTDPGRFLEHKSIAIGDMMFLGAGLDMDMPLIKAGGLFDLRAYAAIAATVPWVQTPFEGENPVEAGLKWNLVWNNGNPSNWGASTGFMGNILFLRWRLEYRYFTGLFRTSYFDSLYERNSGAEALSYVPYLDGTKSIGSEPTFSGVFGEAGFDIFKDKLVFSAGLSLAVHHERDLDRSLRRHQERQTGGEPQDQEGSDSPFGPVRKRVLHETDVPVLHHAGQFHFLRHEFHPLRRNSSCRFRKPRISMSRSSSRPSSREILSPEPSSMSMATPQRASKSNRASPSRHAIISDRGRI